MVDEGRVFRLGARPALDGVRAVAVLGVMVAHAQFYRQVRTPGQGGVRGVLVFFVLSGFLITSLIVEEYDASGRLQIGHFYLRRALRLLPALFLLIGVCRLVSSVDPHLTPASTATRAVPVTLFYVANWAIALGHRSLGAFGHLWSLSVEEQFYLVWPLLLVAGLRWLPRGRGLPVLTVMLSAVSGIFYAIVGPTSDARSVGTDASAHGLLIGCALALWLHQAGPAMLSQLGRVSHWLIVPSVIYLAAVFTLVGPPVGLSITYDHVVTELATAVLVAFLVLHQDGVLHRALASRPMVTIGIRSYGLYLWHFPLLVFTLYLTRNADLAACVSLTATFALAFVSYALVERPCLRLRRRFSPDMAREGEEGRPSSSVAPASAAAV